ncbi:sulfur carrier protein [Desulfuromusa kysingii]|uniref:Sulfur carrier protein n=1 Tax=Desulfuromusa kysingii TaxID=37625 RepID=A0A1H3YPR0_9BACT|nr:sulfur carrier protein ThiS [Desulfuromusa kysingii]SEA13024.1 sulfur carrier protein [Desulfuromusa kysingii]
MDLSINGQIKQYQDKITVEQLLRLSGISPGQVVIELNASILSPDLHNKTVLKHGDTIELIQFVGGG